MGLLDTGPEDLGSLARARPRCFHPDFFAAARIGNCPLDWRFHQRWILRRAGLSRLLPEAIRDFYTQPVDCLAPAGCAVRGFARLSGNRSLHEDRRLWGSVWLVCNLAPEPATRHDCACVRG